MKRTIAIILAVAWLAALAFSQSGLNINSALYQAWAFKAPPAAGGPTYYDYLIYTNLVTSASTTDGTNYATGSFTADTNTLILCAIINTCLLTQPPPKPTISGLGLTWVEQFTTNFAFGATPTNRLTVFRAQGSPTPSSTVTAGFGQWGTNQSGCAISVGQWYGVPIGNDGGDAIVQGFSGRADSGANPTVTHSAVAKPWTNAIWFVYGDKVNSSSDSVGTNGMQEWTESLSYGTPASGGAVMTRLCVPDYATTVGWVATSRPWGGYGIEIQPATVGALTNYADVIMDLNGATNGLTLTPPMLALHTRGETATSLGDGSNYMAIGASEYTRYTPIRFGIPAPGYTTVNTTDNTHSLRVTNMVNFPFAQMDVTFGVEKTLVIMSGFMTLGPTNNSPSSTLFDSMIPFDANGVFNSVQLDAGGSGGGWGYGFNLETAPLGVTTHSAYNTNFAKGDRVWITLKTDYNEGRGWCNFYTTNGTQIGSTITSRVDKAGTYGFNWFKVGQNQTAQSSNTVSIFESVIVDYRTGRWPVLP